MFFEIGIRSQDPEYAYRAVEPECTLTVEQLTLNARRRYSTSSEIDQRVAVMISKSPNLLQSAEDIDIATFQEIYLPLALKPNTCIECQANRNCHLVSGNPPSDLRELFPRYLHRPQVIVSVLFENGALLPKVLLPTLCQATPEGIYRVGTLDDDDMEYPDDNSPYSQMRLMDGLLDPETNEYRVIEERNRALNCQFVLTEPLIACMGCTLACPLKDQGGFELV